MNRMGWVLCLGFSMNLFAADFQRITSSCNNIKLVIASVYAECKAKNGGVYKSTIRLRGVNNANGKLKVEDDTSTLSKFHKSCTDSSIDADGILGARCKNDAGQYKWTTLNIGPLLRNYNGTLVHPID